MQVISVGRIWNLYAARESKSSSQNITIRRSRSVDAWTFLVRDSVSICHESQHSEKFRELATQIHPWLSRILRLRSG
jgi:hypothetical protein